MHYNDQPDRDTVNVIGCLAGCTAFVVALIIVFVLAAIGCLYLLWRGIIG